jgi:arylsulfatase
MPTPPNILFICTDQQRYDAAGCYGNQHIQTPTIDRLAEEGVLFEHCYVQSPVCAPSRASLLTGRYVHAHGLYANGVALPEHEQLFSRRLADAGYDCGLIGKLHLAACFGGRTEPRFDDGFRYFKWAHDPYHRSPGNLYHRWLEEHYPDLYAEATEKRLGGSFDTLPAEAHYSHWVAEQAIDFLQTARDPNKPFCLAVLLVRKLFRSASRVWCAAGVHPALRTGDAAAADRVSRRAGDQATDPDRGVICHLRRPRAGLHNLCSG